MRPYPLLVGLVSMLALAGCEPASADTVDVLVLSGATLIDETDAPPLGDAVADGRIAAVGPAREVEIPAGATVEDLSGRSLLPGLTDVHAHALLPTWSCSRQTRS